MGRHKTIETEALLTVAREVFTEHGIAASTREVARRAGISEAVIYQRFPNKAELFFEAMAPPAIDFDAIFNPSGDTIPEQLEHIARGLLAYFRETLPIVLALATHPDFDYEDYARRHPDSPLTRVREDMIRYLRRRAEQGAIEPHQVQSAGLILVSTLQSMALFEKLGAHGGRFDNSMIEAIVHTLWRGISPKP